MAEELSFRGFFQVVRSRWRTFLVVGVVATALSAVLSGPTFVTPRYLSTSIVFPVNLNSYSTETRTDQLLQLLESNSIRDSLIRHFDLALHYEVDTSDNGGYYQLYNEFNDRVEISKTRYESVQLEVVDEDPVRARDMVVDMLHQVDLLARRLQREKSQEVLRIAERSLSHERHKLDSVEMMLDSLRQATGLLVYEGQTEELTRGYLLLLSNPNVPTSRLDEVREMFRRLQESGGEFRHLTAMSDRFRANYDRLLTEYERVVNDVTKELTYTNVVVYPEVPDRKVFPVRWLIVLVTAMSALFLAFVLLVWRDQRS